MGIFKDVVIKNGGPKNLISMISKPTLESADKLFCHPDIKLICAAGVPGLVKAALEKFITAMENAGASAA